MTPRKSHPQLQPPQTLTQKTEERLRKHQRALEKTQRELDRERVKLENQEKKLVQEIKKSAKNGNMGACKIQAKDLVRTRRYAGPNQTPQLPLLKSYGIVSIPSNTDKNPTPQLHPKILLHAHPTASHIPPHPNRPLQRTNDAIDERRHLPPRQHEPPDEPPRPAADSDGV